MGDVKRWSVTYTKHIKQKRKVYQDGLLELHSSIHKVMLYDDCEKLLDSRFLKKEEVVSFGETLAFDAYLIDIGDLDGDHKPTPDLKFQGRDKKITEKVRLLHGKKFRNNPITVEDKKTNAGKNKTPSNPSASQKIIREFKKSELHKYGAPQSSPETTKSSITEWQALYTTQITQKAKKYHDGILRLSICGSQGRQIMLYDASRKLLDSRFLKKDEVIGSGESLTFDAHLVDIGELEGNLEPPMDLNVQGRNYNVVGKKGRLHGQQARHNSSVEWDALYTTQITQKAKKYHSGILRLAFCGSHQMKVTLLNEDGTTLSSKYLKLSEDVRTRSTLELPKYLVEVGEPREKSPEGKPQNNACSGKDVVSNFSSSSVDKMKFSRGIPINKPLRDTHDILSILKKPMAQESIVPMRKVAEEQCHASQSSELVNFDLQDQVQEQLVHASEYSNKSAAEIYEDDFKALDEETTTAHTYRSEVSESKAVHNVKLADCDNSGEQQSKNSTSSGFSLGSGASNISGPKFDAGYTERSMTRPTLSTEGPRVLDSILLDFPEDTRPPSASALKGGSHGNVDIGESFELMSSKAIPSCSGSQFSKDVEIGNSHQPYAENMVTDTRWYEGAFTLGISRSSSRASHGPGDVERKSSEEPKSARKTDECPSFDLGF